MRSSAASIETIRSRQNNRLKDLRQRLLRPNYASDGLIAIEGENLLREAVRSGLRIDTLFLREDQALKKTQNYFNAGRKAGPSTASLLCKDFAQDDDPLFGNPLTFTVAADAFNHACATESPQGIAALVEAPQWSFESLLGAEDPRLAVLAGLQDPGNVGTIIRTAEAFAATGVLLTPPSIRPWNQKVIRASTGSSFRLPVAPLENIERLGRLRNVHIPLYACSAQTGDSLTEANLRGPMAFVIGNEGAGISDDVLQFCSGTIHIPCPGPVESLNAGVAAAILLYEASRQRRQASIEDKS